MAVSGRLVQSVHRALDQIRTDFDIKRDALQPDDVAWANLGDLYKLLQRAYQRDHEGTI